MMGMMKRVLPFVILALVVALVLWWVFFNPSPKPNQEGLSGDIAKLVVQTAAIVDRFGEYIPTAFVTESETMYDAQGQVLELKRYRSDNQLDYGIRYSYQQDKLLEEQSFSSGEAALYKWVYTYNPQELLASLSGYDSNGQLDFHTLYEYDNNGHLTKETSFNPDETFSYVAEQSNNRNGSERKTTYFALDNSEDYRSEEAFDKDGNRILERNLDAEGRLEYEVGYRYDKEGRLLEEEVKNTENKLEYRLTNRYDDKGNLLETIEYDQDNKVFNTYTYSYDQHNNITERITQDQDGNKSIYRYSYVYDEQGNWISRETQKRIDKLGQEDFEPSEITKREITYFPK
jgi:hypothetical protein